MEAKMFGVVDCAFRDGSYPCGYEGGHKLPDCELCHKIRKAGIREAVEWVDQYLSGDLWQAQKKNWGIESEETPA